MRQILRLNLLQLLFKKRQYYLALSYVNQNENLMHLMARELRESFDLNPSNFFQSLVKHKLNWQKNMNLLQHCIRLTSTYKIAFFLERI